MPARFDVSTAEAYLTKSVAASSGYTIEFELYYPSSIPDIGGVFDPNQIEIGSLVEFSADYIFPDNGGPLGWDTNTLSRQGTVVTDAWQPFSILVTNVGGTSWDVTWTVNGANIGTDSAQTFDVDDSQPLPFVLGGRALGFAAGQIFYMRNVVVRDAGGTAIFSDDLAGDLSKWDSVVGAASIVPSPWRAEFDVSVADGAGWATVARGARDHYDITVNCLIPQATLDSLAGAASALFVNIGDESGSPGDNMLAIWTGTEYQFQSGRGRHRAERSSLTSRSTSSRRSTSSAAQAGILAGRPTGRSSEPTRVSTSDSATPIRCRYGSAPRRSSR